MNCGVIRLNREIKRLRARGQIDSYTGVLRKKVGKSRRKPMCRKRGQNREIEFPAMRVRVKFDACACDQFDAPSNVLGIGRSCGCQV
jgi:hypothetical protein